MQGTDVFPNMVIQMVSIGEEAGSLDTMLSKVADYFEAEVDDAVEALSSLMEPMIMVVLGTLIGTLLVRPDLLAALRGFLSFGHIPPTPSSAPAAFRQNALPLLAVTFGYVGGSVMTYLVYPDFIALHGWGMTGHPQAEEIRQRAAAGSPADYLPVDPAAAAVVRRAAAPVRRRAGAPRGSGT